MYIDRMFLGCTGTMEGGSLWGDTGISGILASCCGAGDYGFWGFWYALGECLGGDATAGPMGLLSTCIECIPCGGIIGGIASIVVGLLPFLFP
jgi:hypothetical protein